jgi:hypothetical protein
LAQGGERKVGELGHPMMSVQCQACGHCELGSMDLCPECGAAVFATVIADDLYDDDARLDLQESGDAALVPKFLQSAACRQLRAIIQAAESDKLDPDTYDGLLAELEVYIEREIVRFRLMPEVDHPGYSGGCMLVVQGLQYLSAACQIAGELGRQGCTVLSVAIQMATDADIQIAQGRQMLERAAS